MKKQILTPEQKEAKRIYKAEYYKKNKERIRKEQVEYYKQNSDKIKTNVSEYRKNNKNKIDNYKPIKNEKQKLYFQINKEKIYKRKNKSDNERYKKDIIFKLSKRMRNSVNKSVKCKFNRKESKTQDMLGCTISELKTYLESQFEHWMNWDNHGLYNGETDYGWDIDHIIPISSANDYDKAVELSHYSNLQPLCSKVNRDIKRGNSLS